MEKAVRRVLLSVATLASIATGGWAALERQSERVTANQNYIRERMRECDRISYPEDRPICRAEVARRYED